MENEIKIEIPKVEEKEVSVISSGEIGSIKKKFEKIDQVLFGIMLAVVLSMIAIIISVIGLFLDQMRFNNTTYKEYSQRNELIENMQKINQELLQQNKSNQEAIIELQKQLLLKK